MGFDLRKRLGGCDPDKTGLFIALTLVVIVVIAILVRNSTGAVLLILAVLALAFLVVSGREARSPKNKRSSQRLTQSNFETDLLTPEHEARSASFCPAAGKREGFAPYTALPGPEAPLPIATDARDIDTDAELPAARLRDYPGAIEATGYDVDSAGGPMFAAGILPSEPDMWPVGFGSDTVPSMPDITEDESWVSGHKDRLEIEYVPEGNPFELGRFDAPKAAAPCEDDDAYDVYDIDELNANQLLARNDATRVTAGTMRRLQEMDKYFREEVEEREDIPWWGRHEI